MYTSNVYLVLFTKFQVYLSLYFNAKIMIYIIVWAICITELVHVMLMIYICIGVTSYSYYLHGISRPNIYGVPQVDLSKDREAVTNLPDGLSLSSNQMAMERVICKVFTHYHCDVIINDRIRSFLQ